MNLDCFVADLQHKQESVSKKQLLKHKLIFFIVNDPVYIQNFLGWYPLIPVTVLQWRGPVFYKFKTQPDDIVRCHVDQIVVVCLLKPSNPFQNKI